MFDEDFIDFLISPLNWDKKTYKFNREEKDMHPYSFSKKKDETIITHNVLGIDKKDLKINLQAKQGITASFLTITGKTKEEITGKEYSINSVFALDPTQLDLSRITSTTKNGVLYIRIPNKKDTPKENISIEII